MLGADARTGTFCHGEQPGMADACLYAQVIANRRFEVDMAPYPTLARIFAAAAELPAFEKAAPENQPDAE
jgi:maleylacetoacetate isomerase